VRLVPALDTLAAVSEDSIRNLIATFGAAWNDHDLDAALALTTEDVVFESTGPSPDGVRSVGRDAVRAAWAPIFADEAAHFDAEELLVSGDRATQCWTYRWADGRVRGIDLFTIRDDLVAEKLSYVKG
jgi:ketosteroid isomerase-like protein